jgi:HlyD family secretion protein
MKKKIIPVALLMLIGGGLFFYFRSNKPEDKNIIRVSGNVEITDAALSFKISGRVAERLVSEGDSVKKDQIAARLDDLDLRQEVDLRKSEVDAARAALKELQTGSRPEEIAQAQAVLARVESEQENARREYERQQDLFEKEVISKRELDAAQMNFETSQARVVEAAKALKLVQQGPRIEKIEQSQAQLQRAQKALDLAETKLEYATLASPMDGIVLTENIEPGEYVSAGTPVVTVGKMDLVWIRAFIDETDLGRVRVGQQVRVKTDTYPDKVYEGKISFIASESEFTPKTVQTDKERVKLVYRIKIDVANPDMDLKPGMPADGEILIATAM